MKSRTINLTNLFNLTIIPITLVTLSSCSTLDTKDEYAKAAVAQQACMHQTETQYEITIFNQDDKDNNGKMKTKTTCSHIIAQSDIEKQNMQK